MKIDAHQHFWNFDPVKHSWITEEMSVLRKDYIAEDLKSVAIGQGFDGSVLVQADQTTGENDFLLSIAQKDNFVKAVVGWVDFTKDDVEVSLEYYKQFPKMKGFRHVLQGEKKRDYMLQSSFKKGIAKLLKYGYTYDILIFQDQLKYIGEFVEAFPDQPFVIDHLAKPNIKGKQIDEWRNEIKSLAKFDNLHCKISGMVTEADWEKWKPDDFYPYMDVVVEAFGSNRIMFGSDWPVCLLAAEYEQVLQITKEYFSRYSKDEQAMFYGENAKRFYKLT
jgi:L-fuconolactonase